MKINTRTSTMVPPIGHRQAQIFSLETSVVREAIGKTLVPFYPMGGRLQRDADGRVEINCKGQGVLFVEADADAVVADFGNFAPQPALQELVPKVELTEDISSYPLLVLQVTRFRCGGVAFGVGMQHHVADGWSGIQFINTIADFARGALVTVTPIYDRTVLRARSPPTPTAPHVEYHPPPRLISSPKKELPANGHTNHASFLVANGGVVNVEGPPVVNNGMQQHAKEQANYHHHHHHPNGLSNAKENAEKVSPITTLNGEAVNGTGEAQHVANEPPMAVEVFVISKEKLATLKKKGLHADNKNLYSTYEMLSAHIWKCMTRARSLNGLHQPTKLYIATDGRARLVPRLPKDYFGNVIFTATPMSTAGDVVCKPLYATAQTIHDAVSRMDDQYLRSALDYLELQPDLSKLVRGAHSFKSPNLGITSWARLPLYDCDFGWGRPIFMGPACIAFDGLVYVLPSPVNDGSLTLSLGLRADCMPKFGELIMNVDDAE